MLVMLSLLLSTGFAQEPVSLAMKSKTAKVVATAFDGLGEIDVITSTGTTSVVFTHPRFEDRRDDLRLLEVMMTEILANPDAFRPGRDVTLGTFEDPLDFRPDEGKDEGGPIPDFGALVGDLLAVGQHRVGGGGGETCFDGVSGPPPSPLGKGDIAPVTGASETRTHDDGSTTTRYYDDTGLAYIVEKSATREWYGQDRDGKFARFETTETRTKDSEGVLLYASTDSTTSKRNADGGVDKVRTEMWQGDAVLETTVTTTSTDANGHVTSTSSVNVRNDATAVTTTYSHNGEVQATNRVEKAQDDDSAPQMGSEGELDLPGFCVPDVLASQMINWSRLGAAVTYPSPTEDGSDEGDEDGENIAPIDPIDDWDFVPDLSYMKPYKGEWVTDPVPFVQSGK